MAAFHPYSAFLILLSLPLLTLLPLAATSPRARPPTSIDYYSHVKPGGTVVLPPAFPGSGSDFGSIAVHSAKITQEPDLQSKEVGVVRGLEVHVDTGPSNATSVMLWTVTFADGKYNGTIQVHGQTPQLSVVGGTGDFTGLSGVLSMSRVGDDEIGRIFHHVYNFLPHCSHKCGSILD